MSDEAVEITESGAPDAPFSLGGEGLEGIGDLVDIDSDEPVSSGPTTLEEQLEDVVTALERVTVERNDYLDLAQRLQADFENYKRRVDLQRDELHARAAESLVSELLPVLDAGDAALAHGATEVAPLHAQFEAVLTKRGLTRVDDVDVVFDPNVHEAVLSEPADDDQDEPKVVEVLRAGFLWNGRVVRPAMVKVRS